MFILPLLVWLFVQVSLAYASPPTIIQIPQEIISQASASATVRLFVKNKKNTPYYLTVAFCSEPCHNKFGKTWVGDHWVAYGEKIKQKFLPIITNDQAEWEGEIGFSDNPDDSGYQGAGKYFLKVGYYTAKGNSATWSEAVPIVIKEQGKQEKSGFLDISHLRSAPLETEAKTEGIITIPAGIFGKNTAYLEDDFAGVKVLLNDKTLANKLLLGQAVSLSGTIYSSRGERYFKMGDDNLLEIITRETRPRSPRKIPTGERLDNWEGRLVRVEGKLISQAGNSFFLDDGSGKIKVYLKESASLEKPAWEKGDLIRVSGIVSQWGQLKNGKDNYRLMPRYQTDLETVKQAKNEVATMEDQEDDNLSQATNGVVLGAVALPETGATTFPSLLAFGAMLVALALLRVHLPLKRQSSKSSN